MSECNLLEKIGATLSSCPFRGGDPKYRIQRKGAEREVYIKCRGCNARSGVMRCMPGDLLDALKDAVDAWNRRAAVVVEVKHGRVVTFMDRWKTMHQNCSECGEMLEWKAYPNYCPNCGARMDGE